MVSADSVDPTRSYNLHPGIWHALGDSLVAAAGEQLVPDLAVPQPTDGGRTYTFRLRRGIRYSDGTLLRASDVRHSFERQYALGQPPTEPFAGASACDRAPAGCDLSRAIVADDRAGTVVMHLARPDPLLLYELTIGAARIVPGHTPARLDDRIPGTGPYRVASFVPAGRWCSSATPSSASGRTPRSQTASPTASRSQ